MQKLGRFTYRKLISSPSEGVLIWEGGLFNLEKMMVSVLHKELECKVEKLKYKKVRGHAAEDQNQIRTSRWELNHPRSVHTKFNSHDWLIQSLIYKWKIIRGGEEGAH